MTDYRVRWSTLAIAGVRFRLRVLLDAQQYSDPDGLGAEAGISSAQWSLFGQVWPASRVLAEVMAGFDTTGKRILELGCGIGLPSLVLQRRRADVVATDVHPLAEVFLAYNAAANQLAAVHYRRLHWDFPLPTLGRFDVVIASDVLYERGQAERLDALIQRCARPAAEVVITDPGRGHAARFSRLMASRGFTGDSERYAMDDTASAPPRGRILRYRRGLPA